MAILKGRQCAICGKSGGSAYTLPLKWLREAGVKLKNEGSYAHVKCLSKVRKKESKK